jgi:S-DNA-T family DNA segregation ATPase FtsK/SpoIIIE
MEATAPARRLVSPTIRAIMVRRLAEFFGVALGLAAVALLVALASYDALDPSLDTATLRTPTNLAGPPGAIAADLLLQGFGAAAILPSLAALAWAWRIASHRGLGNFGARLATTLGALIVSAALLGALPWPEVMAHWPAAPGPGGAAGAVLSRAALGWARALLGPFGGLAAGAAGLLMAAGLVWAGLGLSVRDWQAAGAAARTSWQHGRRTAGLLPRLLRPLAWLGRRLGTSDEAETVPPPMAPYPDTGFPDRPSAGFTDRAPSGFPPSLSPDLAPDAAPPRGRAKPARIAPSPRLDPRVAAAADPVRAPAPPRPDPAPIMPPPPPVAAAAPVARTAPKVSPSRKAMPLLRQESLPLPDSSHGGWQFPPLALLTPAPLRATVGPSEDALQANARLLEQVLSEYGVQGVIRDIRPGPVVTLYELEPAPGIRSARVIGLADDVARSLCVTAVRIATVPGRNVIGIEVPNAKRETVYLSEIIGGEVFGKHPAKLALALGKDIGGEAIVADLARMPHLLVAGTTGSGKSVGINAMILSLLYRLSPDQCRLILIDPKMLELSVYEGIPHLMAPVVTEPAKAVTALKWTVREMERRYRAMSQLGVRNVGGYNERVVDARARGEIVTRRVQTGFDSETGKPIFEEQPLALEPLPLLVVVIDEMADLMMVAGKEIEAAVQRLAQMARAAGIHVVMATQRPSVDVITGTIKANFPTRISFTVISKFDSRTILGEQGAEQLLGQGDMLYMQGGGRIGRVHGPFVTDREVEDVVAFLREQGEPAYVEEVTEAQDEDSGPALSGIAGAGDGEKGLFDQAVDVVSREGKASTSFIQRHLSIGYNRAAKLIEQMEKEGIVSPANHVGKREVLVRRTNED